MKAALILFASLTVMSLVSTSVQASGSQSCEDSIGSCNYYHCRESVQRCGEDGYFLHFGYRYCTRFFADVRPQVSLREQLWLERVGSCLQRKVEEIPVSRTCSMIEELAIASHTECYIQTGFCAMPFSLKLRLLKVIHQELRDRRMRDTFFKIVKRCEQLPAFSRPRDYPEPFLKGSELLEALDDAAVRESDVKHLDELLLQSGVDDLF